MTARGSLAVVVPTLDEADRLPLLLADLAPLRADVVVADGGSGDATLEVAATGGARVVTAPRGRGRQLHRGALAAQAEWLFFVHADSRLPPASRTALERFLASAPETDFAHFRFALEGRRPFYRFLEFGQRLRERWTGMAYGDQGLLVSRSLYERAGGYPAWPILEDVGMLERLGAVGRRVALDAHLVTSPRRYEAHGRVRGWLRNAAIIGLYRLGASPDRLAERFPRPSSPVPIRRPATRRTVIVFAKAPRPGYVKTRLAAEVGPEEATRIYRRLGRDTVDALRSGPDRLVVYYDPPRPDAAAEVAAWLGRDRVEYRPQAEGDLGERMERALAECLADADAACVVGTDTPGVDSGTVGRAFRLLDERDVVIGPATDGGYWLIGVKRPVDGLFRDVPWSTSGVLSATLERAAAAGALVGLLEPKTDVDTAEDVPRDLAPA